MSDATAVGIIGCGNISDVYAEKLSALPFVDLVACADREPEHAERLAKSWAIPKVLDPDALIADDEVRVIVNLTIPAAHQPVSLRAVQAGKSVFCEKPLALALEDGIALGTAAGTAGVRVGCAPDTFLGGGLQTCRKLIDDGAIGEPVGASGFLLSPGPEGWHPGPAIFYQRGAGPLFDMGPYYLTALVHLLGPVRRVSASARITHAQRVIHSEPLRGQRMKVEVPTHVASVLDFESGPLVSLTTSFDVQATRLRNLEIYGSEATLSVPDPNTFGGPVTIRRRGETAWTEIPLSHGNAAQSRGIGLAEMIAAVRAGRPHRASLEISTHVLDLMESIALLRTGHAPHAADPLRAPGGAPTGTSRRPVRKLTPPDHRLSAWDLLDAPLTWCESERPLRGGLRFSSWPMSVRAARSPGTPARRP